MPVFLHCDPPDNPSEDYIKSHWCSSFKVATAVAQDITSRFGVTVKVDPEDLTQVMHLDFGGSMRANWEPEKVGNFSYWPHQLSSVIYAINQALDRPREGEYIKLHGRWTCVCMSVTEGEQLLDALKDPSHAEKESTVLGEWDRIMEKMREESPPSLLIPPKPEAGEVM